MSEYIENMMVRTLVTLCVKPYVELYRMSTHTNDILVEAALEVMPETFTVRAYAMAVDKYAQTIVALLESNDFTLTPETAKDVAVRVAAVFTSLQADDPKDLLASAKDHMEETNVLNGEPLIVTMAAIALENSLKLG